MNRAAVKPAVYLETTIISYLAARSSGDLIVAAHQQQEHMGWQHRRPAFEVYVQQLVLDEAAAGDPVATGLIAASHEAMGFVAPTRRQFNLTSEVNSGILIETRSFCGCPPPVPSAKGAGGPRSGRCPRSR